MIAPLLGLGRAARSAVLGRRAGGLVVLALTWGCLCTNGCASTSSAVVVTPPRAGTPPLIVGVVADTLDASGSSRALEQRKIRSLGVRWIREDVRWPALEPRPGVFRWNSFDHLMIAAAKHGLHVLPLLLGTPQWAGPAPFDLPNDPAEFGAFAARVAARYGPRGVFWRHHHRLHSDLAPQWFEVWNEPYTLPYSQSGIDPARYAQMVMAAARDGRAANPRTRWLLAADLYYKTATGEGDWLAALYAAEPNLNRAFDGVAIHPYSFYGPTAGASAAALEYRFDRIGAIARELARHGAGHKPLWITELGWSTCQLRPDCVSAHDQAQRLAAAFAQIRTRYAHLVKALFVYDLRDSSGGTADDREADYGLSRSNLAPKPAWWVIKAEARFADR